MSSSVEDGAEGFLEGIDQDDFEGEDALVGFFEFLATLGCCDFDPVGGAVAGAGREGKEGGRRDCGSVPTVGSKSGYC